MINQIKAIETTYKDCKFRSRLESRWAIFFDALNIPWEYEFEGFDLQAHGWYLPDFWLPEQQYWFEVKPTQLEPHDPSILKYVALANYTGNHVVVTAGSPELKTSCEWPDVGNLHWIWPRDDFDDDDSFGGMQWVYQDGIGFRVGAKTLGCVINDFKAGIYHDGELDNRHSLIAQAVAAARSARFEHGEKPQ